MPRQKRFIIDFHITGLCNLQCPFCCGTRKRIIGADRRTVQSVIDKLKKAGVTTVVLTGGEPLMRGDLPQLIKYIYQRGIEVYLSTNGVLLLKYWPKIKKYLACVGLPLDGSTVLMSQKMGRDVKSYRAVIKILKFFKHNPPPCLVKVGTVVSKINKNNLSQIGRLIFKNNSLYRPNIWRLYQFSPLSFGTENRQEYEIGDKEFVRLCRESSKTFLGCKIVPLSNADSNDSYFFIDPDLKIILLTNDKFAEVGDIRTASADFFKSLKERYNQAVKKGAQNRRWLSK